MGQKLPPDQLELYKRIDEILFYKWDPIGISNTDWSRDEYILYLPNVFAMVLEYNQPEKIAEYLDVVTTQNMGLGSRPIHDLGIAQLMLLVKEQCLKK